MIDMAKRIHDLNERVQDIRREQAAQRVTIDTRVKNGRLAHAIHDRNVKPNSVINLN